MGQSRRNLLVSHRRFFLGSSRNQAGWVKCQRTRGGLGNLGTVNLKTLEEIAVALNKCGINKDKSCHTNGSPCLKVTSLDSQRNVVGVMSFDFCKPLNNISPKIDEVTNSNIIMKREGGREGRKEEMRDGRRERGREGRTEGGKEGQRKGREGRKEGQRKGRKEKRNEGGKERKGGKEGGEGGKEGKEGRKEGREGRKEEMRKGGRERRKDRGREGRKERREGRKEGGKEGREAGEGKGGRPMLHQQKDGVDQMPSLFFSVLHWPGHSCSGHHIFGRALTTWSVSRGEQSRRLEIWEKNLKKEWWGVLRILVKRRHWGEMIRVFNYLVNAGAECCAGLSFIGNTWLESDSHLSGLLMDSCPEHFGGDVL
ncbi:High mobility group nucleosome-binding domain-containing protein 5, partial [Ophiophagus hannah]